MATATTNGARRAGQPEGPHLTVAERVARDKAARAEVPRLEPRPVRASAPPPRSDSKLLQRQAETRVPELVPIRYGRMLVSHSPSIGARR